MSVSHARWAHRLGSLALLPFVAGAALVWLLRGAESARAALALGAYAATVVSFIGGIHWGLAFREAEPPVRLFVWGVVPAIVAWAALLAPAPAALVAYAVILTLCYAVDRRVYPLHGAAHWLPLRLHLTAIAAASCLAGAAGLSV